MDEYAVGAFMNGEVIVCNSNENNHSSGKCYIYDNVVRKQFNRT